MLDIIYEDSSILVVKKRAGISVQTANLRQKDLVSEIKNYRMKKKEEPFVGVVHRLDQPVSGVMVFGKTKEATTFLNEQIREKTAEKEYMARVTWDENQKPLEKGQKGQMVDFLLKDGKTNMSSVVPEGTADAKRASLSYEVVDVDEDSALVHIILDTGRHHQIRVQFSGAGYPLVGDQKYGSEKARAMAGNVSLCSVKIGFIHPDTKKKMEFSIEANL